MESKAYVPPIQPILTIQFDSPEEARDLYDQLRTWNSGRQSPLVEEFFRALERCFQK